MTHKYNLIRLFVPHSLSQGDTAELNANQAHYLKQVMRKNIADEILIFNDKDGEWLTEIIDLGKKSCDVTVKHQTRLPQTEPDVWLCFAPIKNGKIEHLVQKATELGASALQPVITSRTIVTKTKKTKLATYAVEATEQCERLSVPRVFEDAKLSTLLGNWPKDRHILLCDESGEGQAARDILPTLTKGEKWAIFIGPEGGFSDEEFTLLRAQKITIAISLGPRILRADTAAISALTCWQEHLGDWGMKPDFRG